MPEWTASHEPAANYGDVAGEYQAARGGAALFDLSHRGKLEVSGADAATFLHNLTTNDVKDMPVGAGCEAFHTLATAKVVDHFYLYHILLHDGRDAFWLDLTMKGKEFTFGSEKVVGDPSLVFLKQESGGMLQLPIWPFILASPRPPGTPPEK